MDKVIYLPSILNVKGQDISSEELHLKDPDIEKAKAVILENVLKESKKDESSI